MLSCSHSSRFPYSFTRFSNRCSCPRLTLSPISADRRHRLIDSNLAPRSCDRGRCNANRIIRFSPETRFLWISARLAVISLLRHAFVIQLTLSPWLRASPPSQHLRPAKDNTPYLLTYRLLGTWPPLFIKSDTFNQSPGKEEALIKEKQSGRRQREPRVCCVKLLISTLFILAIMIRAWRTRARVSLQRSPCSAAAFQSPVLPLSFHVTPTQHVPKELSRSV